ncbi:aminoglycoside phosphotransferase family protein [Pseudomonas aeruginosa]|uniref:aminoglycoside phosphotransferase family protein n=1 Tax=Pseudomonas aeruginosa TaxID=287 RepID=UPI0030F0061F
MDEHPVWTIRRGVLASGTFGLRRSPLYFRVAIPAAKMPSRVSRAMPIAQMADAFSRALDVDPRRLLDQAYAYGCLSAAWNADGEEEQRDLAIAAAIKQVRQTSY